MKRLVFATNNAHKLQEIRAILGNAVEVHSLSDIGCNADIPETGNTLEANATLKAQYIYERYQCNCFADDTGLEVEALNGAPGVYSARYAGEPSNSERNIDKLLAALEGESNRKAQFRTVIAYIHNGELHLFEGIVRGSIALSREGSGGFGYDSVFVPEGYADTFAALPAEEKNRISHRARATAQFTQYLNQEL